MKYFFKKKTTHIFFFFPLSNSSPRFKRRGKGTVEMESLLSKYNFIFVLCIQTYTLKTRTGISSSFDRRLNHHLNYLLFSIKYTITLNNLLVCYFTKIKYTNSQLTISFPYYLHHWHSFKVPISNGWIINHYQWWTIWVVVFKINHYQWCIIWEVVFKLDFWLFIVNVNFM